MKLEHPILRCLRAHTGPRSIDDVARDTGLSRRAVEAELEDLRVEGHAIVAGPDGVWLASDPAELEAYVEQRRRRATSIHRGTMALRRTLVAMRLASARVEQPSIWTAA